MCEALAFRLAPGLGISLGGPTRIVGDHFQDIYHDQRRKLVTHGLWQRERRECLVVEG